MGTELQGDSDRRRAAQGGQYVPPRPTAHPQGIPVHKAGVTDLYEAVPGLVVPALPQLPLPSKRGLRIDLVGDEVQHNVAVVDVVRHEVHDLLALPIRQLPLHHPDEVAELVVLLLAVILE